MDEVRFVMKCFLFAALLMVVSQLKTKSGTIETDIQAALVNSKTAEFVNMAAQGGHKGLKEFGDYIKSVFHNQTKTLAQLSEKKESSGAAVGQTAVATVQKIKEKAMDSEIISNETWNMIEAESRAALKKGKEAFEEPLIEEIE